MNILDILIMYRCQFKEFGVEEANQWLTQCASTQKWTKQFCKQIRNCFDYRGDYIRFYGEDGSFEAFLIESKSEET